MNAHSLKSRQLLAALRTLPECRPHNVNGVSAYVEAADKVEELERALGVLRQNMDAAVGTIAQAVRMAWKGAEITQSVRTVLNLPVPQWAQAHGWDYAVPEWLSSEERLVDASWSNGAEMELMYSRAINSKLITLPLGTRVYSVSPTGKHELILLVNPMRPVYEPKQFMQCLGRASRTPRALPPTNIAKEVVR